MGRKNQPPASSGISRREFLIRAGALGFSTASIAVLLDSCRKNPASPPSSGAASPQPSPSESSIPLPDDLKIRHLLRRAGFGASPSEIQHYTSLGLAASVDSLLEYQKVDDSALENRLASLNLDQTKLVDIQRGWLIRMVYTQRPLLEKMVLFWHGILTSGFSKVGSAQFMFNQNQLFRSQALGDYGALLKAVSRDPAMMTWLDSRVNYKKAPNENFARELMELFTLGIGHYTETDVRESARSFTGWSQLGNNFYFDAVEHDTGIKTFLGQKGAFDGDNIIDIILEQPAAAEFICHKLFEFLAYDNPDNNTLSRLAKVFTSSGHNIKAVVREILTSPEFYSDRAYRAKIKSPVEFVAGTLRTLGIETSGAEMVGPIGAMGQVLFNPPDVSGWKGGITWINSNTLLYRINFADLISTARSTNLSFDPAGLLVQNNIPLAKAQDYLLSVLVDGVMAQAEKEILSGYTGALNYPTMTPGRGKSAADEILRSLTYLVLGSPDYQLA